MTIDSYQLLQQLQPAVLPSYAGAASTAPTAGIEHQSFEELLTRARQGHMESGRAVTAGADATQELTSEELQRLASAADLAEASGARKALLIMDGRGLVLDVATRTLSGALSGDAASRVTQLDTAVYVPGADEQEAQPLGPPASRMPPPAVARQIASAQSVAIPGTGHA